MVPSDYLSNNRPVMKSHHQTAQSPPVSHCPALRAGKAALSSWSFDNTDLTRGPIPDAWIQCTGRASSVCLTGSPGHSDLEPQNHRRGSRSSLRMGLQGPAATSTKVAWREGPSSHLSQDRGWAQSL